MKLTDKQAMFLLMVLKDAVQISHTCCGLSWTFEKKTMLDELNQIMNQQSCVLVDLEKIENGEKNEEKN